jgi:hypothetical protein
MNSKYVSLLRCGHTAYYDPEPKPGDTVYCRRCNGYTKVRTSSQEYSWHCPTCHISRPFGTDELEARRGGRRHQRKYHHVTVLRKGYDTVEVLGPEGQGELSVGQERVEWVRAHQGGLRAIIEKTIVQRGQSKVDGA